MYQREYIRVMGFKFVKELEGMTLTEMGGSIKKLPFSPLQQPLIISSRLLAIKRDDKQRFKT